MGSYNFGCMITHTPITYGDPVRLVVLHPTPRGRKSFPIYATDLYTPFSLAIPGLYNDYGTIEADTYHPAFDKSTRLLLTNAVVLEDAHKLDASVPLRPQTPLADILKLLRSDRLAMPVTRLTFKTDLVPLTYGLIHESVWQVLTEPFTPGWDEETSIAAMMKTKDDVLTYYRKNETQPHHINQDGLPGDWSFLMRGSFSQTGLRVSTHHLGHLPHLANACLNVGITPVANRIMEELAGMTVATLAMDAARHTWTQSVGAHQDEAWGIHQKLATAAQALIKAGMADDEEKIKRNTP